MGRMSDLHILATTVKQKVESGMDVEDAIDETLDGSVYEDVRGEVEWAYNEIREI